MQIHRTLAHLSRRSAPLPLINFSTYASTHLYSRGLGLFGALGVCEDLTERNEFCRVKLPMGESDAVKMISAGWAHSAAITESGKLYAWGRLIDFPTLMRLNRIYGLSNFLGRMVARSSNLAFGAEPAYYPLPVLIHDGSKVQSVSCSAGLTVYLDEDGRVFAFGQNKFIQCGYDTKRVQHVHEPFYLSTLPPVKKVEAGLQHCVALTRSGEVYAWGKTEKGRLGVQFTKSDFALEPTKVFIVDNNGNPLEVIDICAGFAHSAAIAEDGAVYVWGKGLSLTEMKESKEDMKVYDEQLLPRRIELPQGVRAKRIYSSNFQIVILADDHSVWMMGLSDIKRRPHNQPTLVRSDFRPVERQIIASNSQQVWVDLDRDHIRKGFNKIVFIAGSDHYQVTTSPPCETTSKPQRLFEFSLSDNDASLSPLKVEEQLPQDNSNLEVVDYSPGWQHELLLVKPRITP